MLSCVVVGYVLGVAVEWKLESLRVSHCALASVALRVACRVACCGE